MIREICDEQAGERLARPRGREADLPVRVVGARVSRARAYWRSALWIIGTVAVLLAWPSSSPDRAAISPSDWDLEIHADGDKPVTALVYGEGSGFHLITVPAAGADPADRPHLPVRPSNGDVHMISLGWDGLSVRTNAPPGGPLISASARARSVTLFSNAQGSGVRTGW